MLFNKKPVYLAKVSYDRRNYNFKEKKELHATDLNINERISLFQEQLENEHISRVPLRYLSDIR